MNGWTGKILRINLSDRQISVIDTKKYEEWIGGHGMGSAIFWDIVKDKTINGFDPSNVVTIMTSPLTGTLVPAASGRTEVQTIGVQSYPIGWYTRSNFGGRFGAMLKFAGWDGIVIEGKADKPVWVDIRNETVKIRTADQLWGMDTWTTQQMIWSEVRGEQQANNWLNLSADDNPKRTTQKPAVLTIGPAGENLSKVACLIHDAGNAAGQGGFGAVWGSKNLKAISVIGTGDIDINDPNKLIGARLWQKKNYAFDLKQLRSGGTMFQSPPSPGLIYGNPPGSARPQVDQRPQACVGCHSGCRARYKDKLGNEATCFATVFYWDAKTLDIQRSASDLINKYGLNAVEVIFGLLYLFMLNQYGILHSGNIPECPLDFNDYGSYQFVEQFVKMVSYGDDGRGNSSEFGHDISGGFVRAAEKWGRLEEDLTSGMLMFPYWGLPIHKEPRAQVYWGYGTILGDRDINEHGLDWLKWDASNAKLYGGTPIAEAEEVVKIITDKMEPFQGNMSMLDFSDENIYSENMAMLVAWHRYYTRFWKQSALFCDWRWPDFVNQYAPGKIGSTGEAEPMFLNAVTGKGMTFLDGINLGKRIWNLDNAIWTLQGRHRDMVHFAPFIYNLPGAAIDVPNAFMPGRKNGKWDYYGYTNRSIDRQQFEQFKTLFYDLMDWDSSTGYPTRKALEPIGLKYVADELEKSGKLGM
jgi:aldehyde:ferredoxin oxidoreductase